MKPATDLCFTCQENASLLMKSANLQDSVKSQRLSDAQEHLKVAKAQVSTTISNVKKLFVSSRSLLHLIQCIIVLTLPNRFIFLFIRNNQVQSFSRHPENVGYLVCVAKHILIKSTT